MKLKLQITHRTPSYAYDTTDGAQLTKELQELMQHSPLMVYQ